MYVVCAIVMLILYYGTHLYNKAEDVFAQLLSVICLIRRKNKRSCQLMTYPLPSENKKKSPTSKQGKQRNHRC